MVLGGRIWKIGDGKVAVGGSKFTAVRGVRVSTTYRRKVARSMRQRNGDEKWNAWLKERERESQATDGRRVSVTVR